MVKCVFHKDWEVAVEIYEIHFQRVYYNPYIAHPIVTLEG